MIILYIGDVMGEVGIQTVESLLPQLREQKAIDLVIAQGENVTQGKGISVADMDRLRAAGVDFFTGGNHIFTRQEIDERLEDDSQPIIRPANYPIGSPGKGFKYIDTKKGKVLVVSLLGSIVGKQSGDELNNPLKTIDKILHEQMEVERAASIVNFHGDYSSEKVMIGNYLDGRVTAVIGDHWHVPTADARVQPKGTAHISDVGMSGILESSLGVEFTSVIPRWRDGTQTRNILETKGQRQFNAVLVTTTDNGLAESIEQIRQIV
jgi:metallophosphoesterase (TIGR00282 family)